MRIKKIHIQNYKSLVDFELDEPPPFCAFVGPNASGKSNIFEALEFMNYVARFSIEAPSFFRGKETIVSYNSRDIRSIIAGNVDMAFEASFQDNFQINFAAYFSNKNKNLFEYVGFKNGSASMPITDTRNPSLRKQILSSFSKRGNTYDNDLECFIDNFSRIFVKLGENRLPSINTRLDSNADNLAEMLHYIFQNKTNKEDFVEWARILIPEFHEIDIIENVSDGSFEFSIYEKSSDKPFPRHLISDGTYNILALMAAVYQTSDPQFLCIEEPENGLHPQAIQYLVDFFKEKCETEGHHIWLNTHSQTLVRCLEIDEIILVNKIEGQTRAKRVTNANDIDIKSDEAWLTNALGGGTIWSK